MSKILLELLEENKKEEVSTTDSMLIIDLNNLVRKNCENMASVLQITKSLDARVSKLEKRIDHALNVIEKDRERRLAKFEKKG